MNAHDPDNLEKRVHAILRSLPDRQAPTGFEARVMAEIERRSSLAWWRRSFTHWPSPVRVGFYLASAAAAAGLVLIPIFALNSTLLHDAAGAVANRFASLLMVRDVSIAVIAKVKLIGAAIPPLWLYGAAAVLAGLYATAGALGAAAYKAASFSRQAT